MHKYGVFGQALIKKCVRYWPKCVPGDEINNYFVGKEMGKPMTYKQEVDGIKFLINYTSNDQFKTKITSLHDILDEIQDHSTGQQVGGQRKSFKYSEPISHDNCAKHWVDNHNNSRHDPLGLEQIWCTSGGQLNNLYFLLQLLR